MLKLVTAPTAPIVTLAEMKKQVRAEFYTDDDDYLVDLALAAEKEIDGRDGWIGRAIRPQTWDYSIEYFPCARGGGYNPVYIPLPPLRNVESVDYTATDGAVTAITDYRVFGVGGFDCGYIVPAMDTSWPATKREPEAIKIRFTAGYDTVPVAFKHAVRLVAAHWFENRETASDVKIQELPRAYDDLLNKLRNWRG